MKYICSAMFIVLLILLCFLGCAEDVGRNTTATAVEESDHYVVFRGDTWPDVVFPHIDHVDREEGVCFRCHYCEKITDQEHLEIV